MNLLLALLIPAIPAWLCLERIVPLGMPARHSLLSGYTLLLGLLQVTLLMRLLSLLGIPFSITSVGLAALPVLLAGLLAPPSWRVAPWPKRNNQVQRETLSRLHYIFLALLLALIAARLVSLGIEAGTRPVWSWDAKQHWTKQAKVFFELGSVVPYVPLNDWLTAGGKGVYTNMHPDYPITTPLLQAWMGTALGGWHDSLVNLPWVAMYISLGLIFYSQARAAGLEVLNACAGTYLVLSLPYLNTHVALAGYADLMMACCFLGAVSAFALWASTRHPGQAILAMLCGLGCLLIKNEGFYWLLSLIPGVAVATLGVQRALAIGLALLLGLLLLLWLLPGDWLIAGHSLNDIALRYRPEAWQAIGQSFFIHDNWHFLAWLFVAALCLTALTNEPSRKVLAPVAACLLSALCLYLALYLLTKHAGGAVRFTSLNRVALHLVPAAGFYVLLVYGGLLKTRE